MIDSSSTCPVCGTVRTHLFLQRDDVPVHQNLVLNTREEAVQIDKGALRMRACGDCGFIFNSAFDASKLSYGAAYDNTQSHSPRFSRHMDDLVSALIHREGVRNCHIVEVGCGKGEFLRKLVTHPDGGNRGTGFDPSYRGPESELGGRLQFYRRFYDDDCSDVPADVVVCRHVIEHTPLPLELLRSVRRALRNAPAPRVFFETPCVAWILKNRVIWDFFYEHCSVFTAASLKTAFLNTGFTVHDVHHVFDGQYLWIAAGTGEGSSPTKIDAGEILPLTAAYAREEAQLIDAWRTHVDALGTYGRVAVWGAGAKGTTFAHLVDPECRRIDCLVDLNPNKQGKFVPGTGHLVTAPEALVDRGITSAILMNPNYLNENEEILSDLGANIALIV